MSSPLENRLDLLSLVGCVVIPDRELLSEYILTWSPQKTRFIEDLEVVLFLVGLGSELRLGRLLHYIYIPFRDIGWIGNMLARLQQQGEKAVRTTKAAPPGSSRTLFSKMIPEDGSEAPLSDNVMAQEAMTAVVAGSDSTTAGICYTIYAVLRHPEVKRKLQQELSSCSDSPGFEELQSKQYLKWVIEEGLRLYPPIPTSLARKVPDNGAILGGYMLPSGTDVVTQAMTMHNNPSVFLEPERFIPERWENSTPAMKDHMMAFGGSMRCKQGSTALTCLLRHHIKPSVGYELTKVVNSMRWRAYSSGRAYFRHRILLQDYA